MPNEFETVSRIVGRLEIKVPYLITRKGNWLRFLRFSAGQVILNGKRSHERWTELKYPARQIDWFGSNTYKTHNLLPSCRAATKDSEKSNLSATYKIARTPPALSHFCYVQRRLPYYLQLSNEMLALIHLLTKESSGLEPLLLSSICLLLPISQSEPTCSLHCWRTPCSQLTHPNVWTQ